MIPPDVARHAVRALVAYRKVLAQSGSSLPDGWHALELLVRAHTRDDDQAPAWLTLDQAASRAHVTPRTLYQWRRDGLASHRAGGRVLIGRDDLDHYIRQHAERLPATVGNRGDRDRPGRDDATNDDTETR